MLRVGFIGAGRISDLHAIEYLNNPAAKIVAVCDVDLGVAERQARHWNVPSSAVYTAYPDLLARDDVDLVEALREAAAFSLTGEQGRDILRFCLAAQRSAHEGRAVRVAEVN